MSDNATLNAFRSIFRGNEQFFVKHQAPFSIDESKDKLKAKWCGFAVYNKRTPAPEGKEAGDLIPVTPELYRAHLNGGDGLAISPLTNVVNDNGDIIKRNVCYFAAIDIDVYGVTFTRLVQRLYQHGFRFIAALSKSGGLHLYFFFEEAEPADKVIEALSRIVQIFGLNRLYVNANNKNKVEIFPKQASFVPGDSNANCLFLPFYNARNKERCKNKMLTADGILLNLPKALSVIDNMFTRVSEINATIDRLPYSDAPFCMQMILLTGILEDGDSRSNFLFSAAVYLKKSIGGDFRAALDEVNNCFAVPLEEKDVESTYNSVTDPEKNYEGYKCKDSPCADYCDKKLCKMRKYGVGRDKGNHLTGADCWGPLAEVVDTGGETQYYIWQVRVQAGEDFRDVRIDNLEDFENQSRIRTACRRDLHWSPNAINQMAWIGITNAAMVDMDVRKRVIAKGTETSENSLLRNAVMRYLTHKQVQNSAPYLIKTGRVYKADGVYYFTTDGLIRFLNLEKVPMHKINLHAKLEDYKCQEGEIAYKTSKGVVINIPCWKKVEDDELREMDIFYEDIYEGQADIIQEKESDNEGGSDVDDTKF